MYKCTYIHVDTYCAVNAWVRDIYLRTYVSTYTYIHTYIHMYTSCRYDTMMAQTLVGPTTSGNGEIRLSRPTFSIESNRDKNSH